jgi:hypothetical protein
VTTVTASANGLGSLPRAGLRNTLGGLQRYFRPGTHRSPLHRLGERFVVDFPGMPKLLVTRSPDDPKPVLTDREQSLSLGGALHRLTPHPVLFGDDSLIFLEGEAHARERRKIAPPFHGGLMKSYERAMAEIASEQIERWPTGDATPFAPLAQQFVLNVMRSVIFGVSEGERMRRIHQAMSKYCRLAESDGFMALGVLGVLLTGRWRRYPPLERAAAAVDEIVLEEIAERRRAGSPHTDDCLALLLELNADDPEPKADAIIARDMRGLMLAGYETTAISLSWMVELIAHRPDVLAELVRGADAGDDRYLDAAIAEALRLRPVFPYTGRRAIRDFELNGINVPAGALIVISIMALHERPDIYPEPLEFRPERFLDTRPGTYTWLPFGGGVHRCLGAAFAQFESRVLLRTLLQRRTLIALGERSERPRRAHPLLVPSHQARVVLEARA